MLHKITKNKKCAPKLIFFNEIFFYKDSDDFWRWKLTLKIRFWHFLTAIFGHLRSLVKKSKAFLWSVQSYLQSEMFLSNSVDMMKNLPLYTRSNIAVITIEVTSGTMITTWSAKSCDMASFKGQIISECLFDFLNFPKNQRKIWQVSAQKSKKWSNQQSKGTFLYTMIIWTI